MPIVTANAEATEADFIRAFNAARRGVARRRIEAAAARSKCTDAELATIATYGPTPFTGTARDYDQAHAASTMLKVRQGVGLPVADVERAAAHLAQLEPAGVAVEA